MQNQQTLENALGAIASCFLITIVIPFLAWLISLIHILKNEFTGSNKIIWVLVTFIPLIGPILYFFIGRNQIINRFNNQ